MDDPLRFLILGLAEEPRWPVLEDAVSALRTVTDVVDRADGSGVEVTLRTDPPQQVQFLPSSRNGARCTCGAHSNQRPCPHVVAARLAWLHETDEDITDDLPLVERRAAAWTALATARAALVDTYLEQDADGDGAAFLDLLCDLGGVEDTLACGRAMVGRATSDQLSRFLLEAVRFWLVNEPVALPRAEVGLAVRLCDHLSSPLDDTAPEANGPALLALLGFMRRSLLPEDELIGRIEGALFAVCRALGGLVRAGHLEAEVLVAQMLDGELAARPGTAVVLGGVASFLDPSGNVVFRPLLAALEELGRDTGSGGSSTTESATEGCLDPRLLAEVAYAADRPDVLVEVLERWRGAPYGEFFARATLSRSLTTRLAIAEAARRAGRVQWVDEPDHPIWSHRYDAEHLGMASVPHRRGPGTERIAFTVVHHVSPEHPSWHRVAIGDLVVLLSALDRVDGARAALIAHARRYPGREHRDEFERIWDAARLGEGCAEAARSLSQAGDGSLDGLTGR